MAILLAFGFLGARGLWEPDEGRYTNVALTMLDRGDWLDPMRNEDTGHWSKPPATYWLIASSFALFGTNTWAARVPSALAYLACLVLVWRCARRLSPGTEWSAAIVLATMFMPFCAGQLVTTDFPLTAMQTLAVYAFVERRFGSGASGWIWLIWAASAAAFMIKGPPALVAWLPMLALAWLVPDRRPGAWAAHAIGLVIFLGLVLPWFILVTQRHAGLMQYFLGAEVVDRLASDRFRRNGQWYGWAVVYVPTLIIGTLPWTGAAWRWLRQLPPRLRAWRSREMRQNEAAMLFVALWVALPLIVFCIARSRLPLYILPIFVPLALAIAKQRSDEGRGLPTLRWIAVWIALLLVIRLVVALLPFRQDSAAWAEAIRARAPGPLSEVVFVEDTPRYGLHLHLGTEIETLSLAPVPQPKFNPVYDEPLIRELAESGEESGQVFVCRQALWGRLEKQINASGYRVRRLGDPYRGRIIFEVLQPYARTPTPTPGHQH